MVGEGATVCATLFLHYAASPSRINLTLFEFAPRARCTPHLERDCDFCWPMIKFTGALSLVKESLCSRWNSIILSLSVWKKESALKKKQRKEEWIRIWTYLDSFQEMSKTKMEEKWREGGREDACTHRRVHVSIIVDLDHCTRRIGSRGICERRSLGRFGRRLIPIRGCDGVATDWNFRGSVGDSGSKTSGRHTGRGEGEGGRRPIFGFTRGIYRWVYYRESICATSCRSEETWRAVGERARTHPVLVNLSSVISSARARARIHVHIRSPGSCPSTACP